MYQSVVRLEKDQHGVLVPESDFKLILFVRDTKDLYLVLVK